VVGRGGFLGTRNEERGMRFYDMLDTQVVVVLVVPIPRMRWSDSFVTRRVI
jgi:hypothetical protein